MATTQAEISNVAMIRRGFEMFATGDLKALADLYAPDAVWRSAPVGVLGGDVSGRDAIFALYAKLASESGDTFRAVPTAYAAAGELVFVQVVSTAQRKGRSLETTDVLVFRVAQELVREIRLYPGDYPSDSAFWS